MIGLLRGILLEKQPPLLVLDVHGIGYEIQVPMTGFYQLPATGSEATLFTHFVVREDAQQLYGFVDRQTRELFRELIRVNGVGPRMALAILSALDASDLVLCIQQNNPETLVRVPGIGRKTAERLLIELKGRVNQWQQDGNSTPAVGSNTAADAIPASTIRQDAESALLSLGYKPQETDKILAAVLKENTVTSSEELIRLALKKMLVR